MRADLLEQSRLRNVDVRDLMVGDRERARLRNVEQFAAVFDPHAQQAGLRAARD